MTIQLPAVGLAAVIVGVMWLYIDAGKGRWATMCRRDPEAETNLLLMELSMTHWPWWRRWKSLLIRSLAIGLWPVGSALGAISRVSRP